MRKTQEELQLRAPKGKYRVVGFALTDKQTYLIGDFPSRDAAEECAKRYGIVGNPVHVYDHGGELLVRYGSRQ